MTLVISGFIFSLLYQSIFGLFGLSVASIDTLAKLKNSEKIVQNMKQRHETKKKNIKKKFIKRGRNRLMAASGGLAPVVGTMVVAGAIVKFSIDEYCEEQMELIEEENILSETQRKYDKNHCLAEAKEDGYELLTDWTSSE